MTSIKAMPIKQNNTTRLSPWGLWPVYPWGLGPSMCQIRMSTCGVGRKYNHIVAGYCHDVCATVSQWDCFAKPIFLPPTRFPAPAGACIAPPSAGQYSWSSKSLRSMIQRRGVFNNKVLPSKFKRLPRILQVSCNDWGYLWDLTSQQLQKDPFLTLGVVFC